MADTFYGKGKYEFIFYTPFALSARIGLHLPPRRARVYSKFLHDNSMNTYNILYAPAWYSQKVASDTDVPNRKTIAKYRNEYNVHLVYRYTRIELTNFCNA